MCIEQGEKESVKAESHGEWAVLKRMGPQEGFTLLLLLWEQLVIHSGTDQVCNFSAPIFRVYAKF